MSGLKLDDLGGQLLRERDAEPAHGRALERQHRMTARIAVGTVIAGLLFAYGVFFGMAYAAGWVVCGG